jgi:hypothetical protein
MLKSNLLGRLVAVWLMCQAGLVLAFPATVARPTQIYQDRYLDAPVSGSLRAGDAVEVRRVQSGWVNIDTARGSGWVRAMYLKGQGASVSQAAQVDGGRTQGTHKVSTTGIRSIARASRHALIIGVGNYQADGVPSLKGVRHDMDSAVTIAKNMGVAEGNITFLRDQEATADGIRNAIARVARNTREGDRVFIYYSGHGTRWIDAAYDPNSCTEGLLAADGRALTNREISALLAPIAKKSEKLLVFYDACHSGGVANQPLKTRSLAPGTKLTPKFVSGVSPALCAKPTNMKTRSLSKELGRVGAVPANTVFVAASRPDEVSFDDASTGGLATVAWRDCLLGQAQDLDASGAVSVNEITVCAQKALDERLKDQPDILGQKITIGGNREFIPTFQVASAQPLSSAMAAASGQTSSDETKEAQERERQAAELARLAKEAKERERLAKEAQERERQAAELARLAEEAKERERLAKEAQERERQAAELARLAEEAKERERLAKDAQERERQAASDRGREQVAAIDSMEPSIPQAEVRAATPANLLRQIFDQRDGNRSLQIEVNKRVLEIKKDALQLSVTSPQNGFLYIALAGSDQKSLYLLFPNKLDANNAISANQRITLPRRQWRIVAGGPRGKDTVLILVTDSPRDLSGLTGQAAGPFTKPLLTPDGRSKLQTLITESGNADQKVCQVGGKKRNLIVQAQCSDSFAAALVEFEER